MFAIFLMLGTIVGAVPMHNVQRMANSTDDLILMAQNHDFKRNAGNNCKSCYKNDV